MNEIKLRYSEPLLREAVRSFFFRAILLQLGISFFIAVAALVAVTGYLISRHDSSWMVGFFIGTILFIGAFLATIYVAHFRNTIGRFRQMRTPEATFGYDEQQVCFTSELGSSTMPWSTITEVWRHPRFWLLLLSKSQFVTLPLDCLDEQTQAFITRKTSEPKA